MRFFEVVLLIADAYWLLNFFLKKHKRKEFAASFAAGGFLVLLIILWREGLRWQMSLGYILMVVFIFFSVQYLRGKTGDSQKLNHRFQIILAVSAVVLILISALLSAYLFPVFQLPEPEGPYSIGTTSFTTTDSSNFQNSNAGQKNPNKILIKIWYPSDLISYDDETEYQNYFSAANGQISVPGIPKFLLGYLKYVKTHIINDADVSKIKKNFPVLFLTHGLKSSELPNFYMIEKLVCQGYFVISFDKVNKSNSTFTNGSGDIGTNQNNSNETEYVLGKLLQLNKNPKSKFFNKLDLNTLGAIGYLDGGLTAIKILSEDKRFIAGVVLDDSVNSLNNYSGLTKPLMFMFTNNKLTGKSNSPANKKNDFENFYQNLKGDSYKLILNGASKYTFTDLPLYSPFYSSKLNTNRAHGIIDDYVLAFFNKYLKDIGSNLLNAPSSDYYEIQFNKRSGRSEQFLRQSPGN